MLLKKFIKPRPSPGQLLIHDRIIGNLRVTSEKLLQCVRVCARLLIEMELWDREVVEIVEIVLIVVGAIALAILS